MAKWSTYHPGFNPETLANNVGLLQMTSAFPNSKKIYNIPNVKARCINMVSDEFINVVRLPKQSYANNTFAGKNVIATGYGRTSNGKLLKHLRIE
jgi:hypothetical protein